MKKNFIRVGIFAALLSITAALVKAEAEAPFSITAEEKGDKAIIRITGYISEWSEASSVDIGVKIDALNEAGYKEATVYVNSKGGVTWEATEIVNSLRRFKGKLNAVGGAMVFSAATYIACNMDTFKVHSNTQFMWHKPHAILSGSYDEILNDLKMLKDAESDYLRLYAEKTGKSEKDLSELWAKGDQWLMGKEIVDDGFADDTLNANADVSAADVKILEAVGAPVVPVATEKPRQKQNDTDMKTIDPTAIGLPADATQVQIDAKLKELKASSEKVAALEKEKTDAEAATKEADITAVLDQGIKDRKFNTETRAEMKTLLEANLEAGKKVIDGMAAVADIDDLEFGGGKGAEARKDWDLEKWQTEDPEGLQAKAEKDEKWFEGLFAASEKK